MFAPRALGGAVFAIATLSLPADLRDLDPLVERLRDARVVWLGEPGWGDGALQEAKARLVRALRERLGFSVLAFEAGAEDVAVMDQALADPSRRTDEAAMEGLPWVWNASAAVLDLLDEVRRPREGLPRMRVAGFAAAPSGRAFERLAERVLARFDAVDPGLVDEPLRRALRRTHRRLLDPPGFAPESRLDEDLAPLERLLHLLERHRERLVARLGAEETLLLRTALENLRDECRIRTLARSAHDEAAAGRLQEAAFARNLLRLVDERFPDERVVIWCTNRLAVRRVRDVELVGEKGAFAGLSMPADALAERLGDRSVSILGLARTGRFGLPARAPRPVPEAAPDSVEARLACFGPLLAIDLRAIPPDDPDLSFLFEPALARPFGYVPTRARWPEHADLFLYVEEMTPARLPGDPASGHEGGG